MTRHPRARLWLFMLTTTLLTFTLVKTVLGWQSDWLLTHHKTAPIIAKNMAANEITGLIDAIPHAHLFGQTITAVGNMPLSNLQLHLTGIVHGAQGSKAYIAIASHAGKIYRTGDQLPYGAKIFAITGDTVILQNEGHLEKLTLPREKLEFKTKNSSRDSELAEGSASSNAMEFS